MIFLKREEPSRCGLAEAVDTGEPGLQGWSETWGATRGLEGHLPQNHPEGVFVCV